MLLWLAGITAGPALGFRCVSLAWRSSTCEGILPDGAGGNVHGFVLQAESYRFLVRNKGICKIGIIQAHFPLFPASHQ